jgi:hypothetical protein
MSRDGGTRGGATGFANTNPPYERAALRRTAISFGAYCLNFSAAFVTASASVAASISPIRVSLLARL